MNRTEAIKKVWNLVEYDKIREAEEIAREYNIEMFFLEIITLHLKMMYFIFKKKVMVNI